MIPNILWSQTSDIISLQLQIINCEDIEFNILENNILQFSGISNKNTTIENKYEFRFRLTSFINSEYKINNNNREINVLLNKNKNNWWNKLTSCNEYKSHIRINWDKWIDEDEDETKNEQNNMFDMNEIMQQMGLNSNNNNDIEDDRSSMECNDDCEHLDIDEDTDIKEINMDNIDSESIIVDYFGNNENNENNILDTNVIEDSVDLLGLEEIQLRSVEKKE